MIFILKIGYMKFALKDDKGLSTVMKVLGSASNIKADLRYKNGGIEFDEKPFALEFEVVPNFKIVKRKKCQATVIEPDEVLPPHMPRSLPFGRRMITG